MKPSPLVFTIRKTAEPKYHHLYVDILAPDPASHKGKLEVLSIKWQADSDDWSRWYGMKAGCSPDCHPHRISTVLTSAAKLAAKLFDTGESPESILDTLAGLGIERAEYDSRVSRHVTERTMQPATLKRYMNDYTRDGSDQCTVAVLADDSQSAIPLLRAEFAKHIAGAYSAAHYAERFAAWMNVGQPVKLDTYARPPEFPSITALLNQPAPLAALAA